MAKTRGVLSFREYTLEAVCRFGELEYAAKKDGLTCLQGQMETFLQYLALGNAGAAEAARASGGAKEQYAYIREHVINFMYR